MDIKDKINAAPKFKGEVKIKKESEGFKFFKMFFAGSFKDACKYAFSNVLIPHTKDAICRTSTNMINYWVNGDKVPMNYVGPAKVSYNSGNVRSYDSYYRNVQAAPAVDPKLQSSNHVYNLSSLISFTDPGDAQIALNIAKEAIAEFQVLSVAEFIDICDTKRVIKPAFTDNSYGWRSLEAAKVFRKDNGEWGISMPKAIVIENKGR